MPPAWEDMAVVGRVARPHGLRGQLVVNVETDFPQDRFRPGAELFLQRAGRAEAVVVTTVRFQRERPIIGLHGVDDVNAASELAGAELRVPVRNLKPLAPGTYYRHDLVGCEVTTIAGTRVGVVREVEGTLGGSRLSIESAAGEVLVPLAEDICRVIDLEAKRIVIDPPEGLIDLNRRPR
jgi:16S rRNA processing protein RimM